MTGTANRREVNNMLSTLRGEHFRHQQNLRQSRSHLYAYNRTSSLRTLPFSLLNLDDPPTLLESVVKPAEDNPTTRRCPGPSPPKSWRLIQPSEEELRDSPSWRIQALSLIASKVPSLSTLIPQPDTIPPLTLLCLKMILCHLKLDAAELRDDILRYIPQHLRSQIIRSCVVQAPLPRWKLDLLYEPHGHAEGELILVGPKACLRDDEFLRNGLRSAKSSASSEEENIEDQIPDAVEEREELEDDWDADEIPIRSLETAIFLSIKMSTATMLTLPPTLVNLVLIGLSSPLPLHRLPNQCPLIEFLDLSYNSWLQAPSLEVSKSVDRVDWARWAKLKFLGWRSCYVVPGMVDKLNKGRWNDVVFVTSS